MRTNRGRTTASLVSSFLIAAGLLISSQAAARKIAPAQIQRLEKAQMELQPGVMPTKMTVKQFLTLLQTRRELQGLGPAEQRWDSHYGTMELTTEFADGVRIQFSFRVTEEKAPKPDIAALEQVSMAGSPMEPQRFMSLMMLELNDTAKNAKAIATHKTETEALATGIEPETIQNPVAPITGAFGIELGADFDSVAAIVEGCEGPLRREPVSPTNPAFICTVNPPEDKKAKPFLRYWVAITPLSLKISSINASTGSQGGSSKEHLMALAKKLQERYGRRGQLGENATIFMKIVQKQNNRLIQMACGSDMTCAAHFENLQVVYKDNDLTQIRDEELVQLETNQAESRKTQEKEKQKGVEDQVERENMSNM